MEQFGEMVGGFSVSRGVCLALMLAFLAATSSFLMICQDEIISRGTGDEPHYLAIAEAIGRYGAVDVSPGYGPGSLIRQALPTLPEVPIPALPGSSARPIEPLHAVETPRGLFSIHNLGLPLLLAPVVALGGKMVAAKRVMVLIAVMIPVIAWRSATLFLPGTGLRLAAAAAISLSAPFLYQAAEIYPDLPAGIAFALPMLALTARRLNKTADPPWINDFLRLVLVALTPWFHMRLVAPMLVCVAARLLLDRDWVKRHRFHRVLWLLLPLCSVAGLAAYNFWAFGALGGPYQGNSLVVSPTALMVLFGLHIDQFQGLFLAAPALMAAVPGLAALCRRDPWLALAMLALHGALVLPNAMHPNWFGGGSLAGRFILAAAVPLIIPAAYGLSLIARRSKALMVLACFIALGFSVNAWIAYTYGDLALPNQPASTYLLDYASFWQPWQRYLPALYQIDMALDHWPNLGWAAVLVCLVGWGWSAAAAAGSRLGLVWLAAAMASVIIGAWATRFEPIIRPLFTAAQMAALAGDGKTAPAMIQLSYGNIEFSPTMAQLLHQLHQRQMPACVEQAPEGAVPMWPCAEVDPSYGRPEAGPRLPWELVRRQFCFARCGPVSDQWGLRRQPSMAITNKTLQVNFGSPEARRYLGHGWSEPENWGFWTEGPDAEILLPVAALPPGDLRIDFDIFGFVTAALPSLDVPVTVNGELLDSWTFRETVNRGRRSLWIPAAVIARQPVLTILFSQLGKMSPAGAGLSQDPRMLGVAVVQMTIFSLRE